MKNPSQYIWHIEDSDLIEDYLTGWYFQNECELLEGPYDTEELAKDALRFHAAELNSPVQGSKDE